MYLVQLSEIPEPVNGSFTDEGNYNSSKRDEIALTLGTVGGRLYQVGEAAVTPEPIQGDTALSYTVGGPESQFETPFRLVLHLIHKFNLPESTIEPLTDGLFAHYNNNVEHEYERITPETMPPGEL